MNIKRAILEGENEKIDFKKTISNAAKIAKSLVAFANSKGGSLLIGVADDGSICGVKEEEEEKFMIRTAAEKYCKPSINPIFQEILIDEKTVIVATIAESNLKPHYALGEDNKWWVYIRIKDETVLASRIMVDVLKQSAKTEGVLISYAESEKKLLKYLDDHGTITLTQFSKLLKSSHKKAQKILVNFLLAKVIKNNGSEEKEYFTAVR